MNLIMKYPQNFTMKV